MLLKKLYFNKELIEKNENVKLISSAVDWIFEQIKSFLWLFVAAVKMASRIISLLSCLAKLLGKWQTAFVMRVSFIYMPYQVHSINSTL